MAETRSSPLPAAPKAWDLATDSLRLPVSIIVPTLQEESTIEGLLDHLSTLGAGEILLVDGGSTDRTVELARKFAGVRILQTRPGRALQMNAGAKASTGAVLLFLHADVRLHNRALHAVRSSLADGRTIGGNFDIRYEGADLAAACFTWINRQRRRLGIFYGDSGIFCLRSVFVELGGYQYWPILEDYEFGRRLWKTGKLALLREPIHVSGRRWRQSGLLWTVWTWIVIQGLYLLGFSPHKLARLYRHVR